jgi:hypothetical protein
MSGCPVCTEEVRLSMFDSCIHEICMNCAVTIAFDAPVCPICRADYTVVTQDGPIQDQLQYHVIPQCFYIRGWQPPISAFCMGLANRLVIERDDLEVRIKMPEYLHNMHGSSTLVWMWETPCPDDDVDIDIEIDEMNIEVPGSPDDMGIEVYGLPDERGIDVYGLPDNMGIEVHQKLPIDNANTRSFAILIDALVAWRDMPIIFTRIIVALHIRRMISEGIFERTIMETDALSIAEREMDRYPGDPPEEAGGLAYTLLYLDTAHYKDIS